MIRVGEAMFGTISRGVTFLSRQPRDWKVTVARTSLSRFIYQMVFPYQSVYVVALGASATQLGIVNSAGMGIAGIWSPFNGWLIDRIGRFILSALVCLLSHILPTAWPRAG